MQQGDVQRTENRDQSVKRTKIKCRSSPGFTFSFVSFVPLWFYDFCLLFPDVWVVDVCPADGDIYQALSVL